LINAINCKVRTKEPNKIQHGKIAESTRKDNTNYIGL
jgi:hypothetical protein